ncbi:MAG: ABC transporter permease [Pirellulales bacterium]|nr:ABC transporter permease [Pirellulales bacterium]
MSITWKLALSYAVRHPARMLLTSLAMVASACIVVWVVSGYDALASQFGQQASEYLGRYDFFVVPEDPNDPSISADLVAALAADPAVAEVAPVAQLDARLMNQNAGPGNSPRPMGEGPGVRAWRGKPGTGNTTGVDRPHPNPLPKGEGTRGGGPKGEGTRGGPGRPGVSFGFGFAPRLVGTDAAAPPHELAEGRWIDPAHPDRRGAVIGVATAERMNLKLGDEALVIVGPKEFRIVIIGLMEEGPPRMLGRGMRSPSSTAPRTGLEAGPASSAVYVPMALAVHFSRGKATINLVNIRLKPAAKPRAAEFRKTWEAKIAKIRPAVSLLGVDDIRSGIEEGMMARRARQEAWAATGLSLLAALFIIFTTLSMGVTERVRQFAVMRAVGLSRGQVAQVIAVEGILLALIGWGGGLLAGWGLLSVASRSQTGLFQTGASLGAWCIVLTGLSALGGALAASILPAWRATRVEPLEAMSPRRSARPNLTWIVALGIAGLALIAVNPILVHAAPASISSDKLYAVYAAVGCTSMAVGFLLFAPAAILIVEAALGPVVAVALGLQPRLLRSQLGGNLWRTLGTTAALTVGLGLFVAMQIWGYSMLEPFKPGDWVPDVLAAFQSGGLPSTEIEAVRAVPGVHPEQCIPLAVEQPKLAADITGSEGRASVIRQDNVIMIGLDPAAAFGGSDPLVKARFVEGTAAEAIAKLKEGRSCIVPDHFLKATGLKLGDHFSMIRPNSPSKRVEYTIAGAVSLPGWHWMTKFSGLRRREGRSAAMVFADYDAVRRDFELNQINFFWMNVDPAYGQRHMAEALAVDKRLKQEAARGSRPGPTGVPSPMAADEPVDARRAAVLLAGEALRSIADRNLGESQPVNSQGTWAGPATTFGSSLRLTTPQTIHDRITRRADGIIWASCYLPLVTLLVTSLGVVNTVMASVRARRWEFGVLRAQGITRSGLVRMILAEGLLIGLITCLLSLGFGVFSGWCGTGISQYVSFFGGLAPPLVIPWAQLSLGFAMALGLCLLAALWPALSTGRAEPLKLLQDGRAAL